ncbi:ciliary microtubule inner protein 1-like [Branchiostoma lanceolatum]|uniref:C20orf85 protein n=1 Tax=Branchiostoma lanceolatum TaxID=7740 RepID=A0A8J9ZW76_BRALA|nr:C20orf85 [Branchiostoma lanceolatum]
MASSRGKDVNFVHSDEIWKDHVRHELRALLHWPDKWGFLKTEYNKVYDRMAGIHVTKTPTLSPVMANYTKLPPISAATKPGSPQRKKSPKERLPSLRPPTPTFPKTTAGLIGWKSARPDCQLEIYGRYAPNARGQKGIIKMLGWPLQGLD